MTPARIADLVFEAMETGQFYILADNPEDLGYVKMSGAVRYQVGDRRTIRWAFFKSSWIPQA